MRGLRRTHCPEEGKRDAGCFVGDGLCATVPAPMKLGHEYAMLVESWGFQNLCSQDYAGMTVGKKIVAKEVEQRTLWTHRFLPALNLLLWKMSEYGALSDSFGR
jgi:hypothetical protein